MITGKICKYSVNIPIPIDVKGDLILSLVITNKYSKLQWMYI